MEKQPTPQWQWLTSRALAGAQDWWDIYQTSFPSAERDPREQLQAAVEQGIATAGVCLLKRNYSVNPSYSCKFPQ